MFEFLQFFLFFSIFTQNYTKDSLFFLQFALSFPVLIKRISLFRHFLFFLSHKTIEFHRLNTIEFFSLDFRNKKHRKIDDILRINNNFDRVLIDV